MKLSSLFSNATLLSAVIILSADISCASGDKETSHQTYAEKCIVNGTKIITLQDRSVNLTSTFNDCYQGKDSSNPLVWYFVGHMQLHGIGASPNLTEGLKFLEKAGYQSHPAAQKELADYYLTGGGVKSRINMKKALEWLSRLALNKKAEYSPEATFRLCSIYLFGTGVDTDYERALTWCRKSGIQQHNYDGLTNLALMYINGWGTSKDPGLAIDYYTTAAKHGVISAQLSLGRAYSLGTDVPADYKLAFQWMAKAAGAGNPLAMFYLGEMYEYGQGVEQDRKSARKLYQKAADLGEPGAQYILGRIYQYGDNPNLDYAAKWYHKAAAQNNSDAMIAIGDLYISQNSREMMKWYRKAAALGNNDGALRQIPYLLTGSRDFSPQPEEALTIAQHLAQKQISGGHYWLGIIYRDGLAGTADPEKAQYELSTAAQLGNTDAALALGESCLKGVFDSCDNNDAEKYLKQASDAGCIKNSCLLLGQLYISQNRNDDALLILDQDQNNPDENIQKERKELLKKLGK